MKIRSRDETIMEIDSIRRMDVKPGESIMIQVDIGTLPPTRAIELLNGVHERFKAVFPQNTIIVAPTSLTITVLP